MKDVFKTLFALIIIVIYSCGPTVEEKATIQKAHDDSIKVAEEKAAVQKAHDDSLQAMTQKAHDDSLRLTFENERRIADSISNAKAIQMKKENEKKIILSYLKDKIADKRTDIRLAKEKLSKIKSFQLGRLPEDKQREVEHQYKVIQFLEQDYEKLQDDLKDFESEKNIDKLIDEYRTKAMNKMTMDSISSANGRNQ